jgi:hypothetical protein
MIPPAAALLQRARLWLRFVSKHASHVACFGFTPAAARWTRAEEEKAEGGKLKAEVSAGGEEEEKADGEGCVVDEGSVRKEFRSPSNHVRRSESGMGMTGCVPGYRRPMTSWPAASAARTKCDPMKPVEPVTKMVMKKKRKVESEKWKPEVEGRKRKRKVESEKWKSEVEGRERKWKVES